MGAYVGPLDFSCANDSFTFSPFPGNSVFENKPAPHFRPNFFHLDEGDLHLTGWSRTGNTVKPAERRGPGSAMGLGGWGVKGWSPEWRPRSPLTVHRSVCLPASSSSLPTAELLTPGAAQSVFAVHTDTFLVSAPKFIIIF